MKELQEFKNLDTKGKITVIALLIFVILLFANLFSLGDDEVKIEDDNANIQYSQNIETTEQPKTTTEPEVDEELEKQKADALEAVKNYSLSQIPEELVNIPDGSTIEEYYHARVNAVGEDPINGVTPIGWGVIEKDGRIIVSYRLIFFSQYDRTPKWEVTPNGNIYALNGHALAITPKLIDERLECQYLLLNEEDQNIFAEYELLINKHSNGESILDEIKSTGESTEFLGISIQPQDTEETLIEKIASKHNLSNEEVNNIIEIGKGSTEKYPNECIVDVFDLIPDTEEFDYK